MKRKLRRLHRALRAAWWAFRNAPALLRMAGDAQVTAHDDADSYRKHAHNGDTDVWLREAYAHAEQMEDLEVWLLKA